MSMRTLLVCSILLLPTIEGVTPVGHAAEPSQAVGKLQLLLTQPPWSQSGDAFMDESAPDGFRWTSAAEDSARAGGGVLNLDGLTIHEALARFGQDGLQNLTFFFYSRGDTGGVPLFQFEEILNHTVETLSAILGGAPEERGRELSGAVATEGLLWQTPQADYLLEWSFQRAVRSRGIPFTAEFIRLQVTQPEEEEDWFAGNFAQGNLLDQAMAQDEEREVAHDINGDIYLPGIPMVDQGARGYCVVATMERVMRYYGIETDQHELAQVAETDPERGTSTTVMMQGLRDLAARLRVRSRSHYEWDFNDFRRILNDYNRTSRRHRDIDQVQIDPYSMTSYSDVLMLVDGDLFKEVRNRRRSELGRFERTVKQYIDQGTPVIWTVMLGLVPEPGRAQQSFGGHMRLIIGYNEQTNEILFSDSWGAGHEKKRLPLDDAWAMTSGIYTIEPL